MLLVSRGADSARRDLPSAHLVRLRLDLDRWPSSCRDKAVSVSVQNLNWFRAIAVRVRTGTWRDFVRRCRAVLALGGALDVVVYV